MAAQPSAFPDRVLAARIETALALVPPIVAQMKRDLGTRMPDGDLTSFGNEGALSAGRTFEPSLGVPFERWASLKIRGKILDGFRGCAPLPRRVYEKLRALRAANDTEEGLVASGRASSRRRAEAADRHLSHHLAAAATSMALGTLFAGDAETLEAIEDERGTLEDEAIREELKARVRAAVTARPEPERQMLERYYFEDMTLVEASGGFSRAWSSRLLARAMVGVGKTLSANARTRGHLARTRAQPRLEPRPSPRTS